MALLTRKPLGRELSMAPPEHTVVVVAWAMYTLRRYVAFAPQTTVVIPDEVQLHVITRKECHMRI